MPPEVNADLVRAALARRQAGDLDGAVKLLERAATSDRSLLPAVGALHFELGNGRLGAGDLDGAAAAFGQAAKLMADDAGSVFNLGVVEQKRGRLAEAEAAYHEALRRDPLLAPGWNCLLLIEKSAGRIADASAAGRRAIAIDPSYYEAVVNLGEWLALLGRIDEGRRLLRRGGTILREAWAALSGLGLAEANAGRIEAALSALRRSLAFNPAGQHAWNNLASAEPDLGGVLLALKRALTLTPSDAAAHSNLIFALSYLPEVSPADRLREAQRWARRHLPPAPAPSFRNRPDPDRRLRIGYVSSDLRRHPIAYNVEDLIRAHDRQSIEIAAYSATPTADGVTQRIAGSVDLWRNVAGMAAQGMADAIRSDGVDILVILAGHAGANPLSVAGFRPAPVQVSFHDVSTSGVAAVDAWLTDPCLHPPDTPELFVEELVRLPCFYLHRPPDEAPSVVRRGEVPIVFGSFNNPLKLGPAVLETWAQVLDATPGSRLLLKYKNRFSSRLLQEGVRQVLGDRVDFLADDVGRAEQLALLNRVDIALDPFPFNGSTTSFEALWMGVPVVTLAGDRFVGRVGASLLAQLGLDDLVAPDISAYVERASALVADRERLARLRAELRDRVRTSRICDPERYARSVENAYRALWRKWCSRR